MIKSRHSIQKGETESEVDRVDHGDPLVEAFHRFVMSIGRNATAAVLDVNLTMVQFRALGTIERLKRTTGRQLARNLGVTPAAVVAICDRLEDHGYVRRVRDLDDRRIWWVEPTPSGTAVVEGLMGRIRPRIKAAFANLSEADRGHLSRILGTLAAAVAVEKEPGTEADPEA